ncbi:hypothetical protein C8N46_11416 [Kordia periserrulae]|uniref:GLPGLI family protein n=1 Tax=Kordia periserrulae TaxID=701523 RepID=A0A2T6BQK4_9FLAO|nr:hypothetical protein [Kordia periserrulae]PTX58371.1 hypothetical protein C8N46_11416 [Kordia periserrulae]
MHLLKYALLVLCCCSISFSFAQEEKIKIKSTEQINVSNLIKDIQILKKEQDNFKMVWWIPTEYWEVVLNGSNVIPAEDIEPFTNTLDEYILVGSMHAEMTQYGDFKPKYINLQLKDSKGNIYEELKSSEISAEYHEILSSLKPSMTETLGELGRQMKFHVFKKTGKDGKLIAPMNQYGEFTILFNKNNKFNYKLPLGSMVEEKMCPQDNELLNGNWRFCPWHGKKLKLQTK